MKKYVEARIARAAGAGLSAARYWHAQSLRTDILSREETGSRCRTLKQRQAEYARRQRRALAHLQQLKLKPPVNVLAKIAGVTPDRARHACAACLRKMKKYFG